MKLHDRLTWALSVDVSDASRRRKREACRRAVLLCYAVHVNADTGLAWLAMETLERETQWERKAILPARRGLVDDLKLLVPAGRHGRSGLPRFRLGCPDIGTSETVSKSPQESQVGHFNRNPEVGAGTSQLGDLTRSQCRDTEQGFELVNEAARARRRSKRGAPAARPDGIDAFAVENSGREFLHKLDGRRFLVVAPSGLSPAMVWETNPRGEQSSSPMTPEFINAVSAGRIEPVPLGTNP